MSGTADQERQPVRAGPAAAPITTRAFRAEFGRLPGLVHEVAPGDSATASGLWLAWKIEEGFVRLGVQDPVDQMLTGCDRLFGQWAAEPSVAHREWLVDALTLTQSVLIEEFERAHGEDPG